MATKKRGETSVKTPRIVPQTATRPGGINIREQVGDPSEIYDPTLAAAQRANPGTFQSAPADMTTSMLNTAANPYATPAQGTGQAQTPFGQSIAPTAYNMAWSNPEALIQQYFTQQGLPERGGGYALAQDEAERLGILWLLLNNSNTPQQGTAGYLDWAGGYLGNQFTPGGPSVSPQDVISAMFGAAADSPVGESLAASNLDPSQQVQNTLSTLAAGLGGNMPSPVLRTLLAQYQKAGDEFTASRLTNPAGGDRFLDYLVSQGLGPQQFGIR
jgi:hypothetical protein